MGPSVPPQKKAAKGRILRWLQGSHDTRWGRDPAVFDAEAIEATIARLSWLGRQLPWFRPDVAGFENIPEPPALLVMNHSGGTSIPDVWAFLAAWYRHFGTSRPIRPLAHELVVGLALTGPYFARRGVLLADNSVAKAALTDCRHDVLVCPGGDIEAWRPYSERYRVDFDGRKGYAKMALQTGVPVVPVAHAGAHETLIVLWQGRRLARALRLPELTRAEIFPIHLSLPWGLAVGPLPHLPWPARMRYRIGPTIALGHSNAPVASPSPKAIDAIDAEVRRAIQDLLDDLRIDASNHRP